MNTKAILVALAALAMNAGALAHGNEEHAGAARKYDASKVEDRRLGARATPPRQLAPFG